MWTNTHKKTSSLPIPPEVLRTSWSYHHRRQWAGRALQFSAPATPGAKRWLRLLLSGPRAIMLSVCGAGQALRPNGSLRCHFVFVFIASLVAFFALVLPFCQIRHCYPARWQNLKCMCFLACSGWDSYHCFPWHTPSQHPGCTMHEAEDKHTLTNPRQIIKTAGKASLHGDCLWRGPP